MTLFLRTLMLATCAGLFLFPHALWAQGTNTPGTIYWPASPPVGIGTVGSGTPQNALQIHHNSSNSIWPAILRLSDGATDSVNSFGALALMPTGGGLSGWSNLAQQYDLIAHEHDGDLILADFDQWGGAIRMSTSPDPTSVPFGTISNDLERMTIDHVGNVGIDLPPKANGLDSVADQVQIGGGILTYPGNAGPVPGLTLYGGNRFEDNILQNGKILPVDRRYISYNHYIDHSDTGYTRFHRFVPMGSSEIDFSSDNGGLLSFNSEPYDSTLGMNSFAHKMVWELSGTYGTGIWLYDSAATVQKHTMFEINPPGIKLGSVTRNTNGLAFFHTPVCITNDTSSYMSIDFQNLPIRPNLGDDTTWDLVVNGAALFKEAFVNIDWPDYVFRPSYKLMPLPDVEKFIENNHHLPDVPSAEEMAKTGVPLGETAATMMKKIEELTEYVIDQNKKIDALTKEVEELKQGKGK